MLAPRSTLLLAAGIFWLMIVPVQAAGTQGNKVMSNDEAAAFNKLARMVSHRVCLVYTAPAYNTTGPDLNSTLYVRQALAIQDVSVTINLEHPMVGALKVGLVADSNQTPQPITVLLKALGPGGLAVRLLNTTFTDAAQASLPLDVGKAAGAGGPMEPFTGSYLPDEPLSPLSTTGSHLQPYAGLGGSVGRWSLLVQDTWPQPETRVLQLHSWQLKLCGYRLPRVADPWAAGAMPPNATQQDSSGVEDTPASSNITSTQQQSAASLEEGKAEAWLQQYKARVLDRLDESLTKLKNATGLGKLKAELMSKLAELQEGLAGLPMSLGLMGNVSIKVEKRRFKELLEDFQLCHNDLYACWKKKQNRTRLFPVARLDQDISERYASRIKKQQQRLTNIEVQVKQAVDRLGEKFPNLAQALGAKQEEVSQLLSKAITSDLYGAAFGSAAIAYYGAYLDAVAGFLNYAYWGRLNIVPNPRAIVYRILAILQGVLDSIFYGLTEVPLFPQLVNPTLRIPVLVSTARNAGMAFRQAVDMTNQAMQDNMEALIARRTDVLSSMTSSLKSTSDAFEQELARSAPGLADLYGAVAQTAEGLINTGGMMRNETLQWLSQRLPVQEELRNQARDALGTLSSIMLELLNTTSGTVAEARTLLDNLVPGESPAAVLQQARDTVNTAMLRASHTLQQVVPLTEVQQLMEVFNGTVDGLLSQVQQEAHNLQERLPGPALSTSMDALQQRLSTAMSQVENTAAAVQANLPGPLMNATLVVINMRTKALVDDVNTVLDQMQKTFPVLDPQHMLRRLNNSIDAWWAQVTQPIKDVARLVPPDRVDNVTHQLVSGIQPLVTSMSTALGKAAQDISKMTVPAVQELEKPAKDTVKGLTDMVTQLNKMIFNLNNPEPLVMMKPKVTHAMNETQPPSPDIPHVQILSDQVQQMLDTLSGAPVASNVLKQLNKSLKDMQASIHAQQARANASQPTNVLDAAVRAILHQVNQSTQPWQQAVQAMDIVRTRLTPSLPPQLTQQVDEFRGFMVDRLSNFTHMAAGLGLMAVNDTGRRTKSNIARVYDTASAALDQGQAVAGWLADGLNAASQRLAVRYRQALPRNTTLQVAREGMAAVLGIPLDQLQAAVVNFTKARPGLIVRASNYSTKFSVAALQALQRQLQPPLQLLADLRGNITSRPLPLSPAAFVRRVNSSIVGALDSALSDWQQMIEQQGLLGSGMSLMPGLLPNWANPAASTSSVSRGDGGPLMRGLENIIRQTQRTIQGQLAPIRQAFSSPAAHNTSQTDITRSRRASNVVSQLISMTRAAAQQMRATQEGLQQASQQLPFIALPPVLDAVQGTLSSMAAVVQRRLLNATLGGLLPLQASDAQQALNPLLAEFKSILDDYTQAQIDTPADLLTFAATSFGRVVSDARAGAGQQVMQGLMGGASTDTLANSTAAGQPNSALLGLRMAARPAARQAVTRLMNILRRTQASM